MEKPPLDRGGWASGKAEGQNLGIGSEEVQGLTGKANKTQFIYFPTTRFYLFIFTGKFTIDVIVFV